MGYVPAIALGARREKGSRNMDRRKLAVVPLFLISVLVLLVAAAACGGDDDDDTGDDGGGEATSAAPAEGPGTVTLTSTAIQGQSGKLLLVLAAEGGQQIARLCAPITSDDFTLPATVMTEVPEGNDPCGGDTAEATLEEGSYQLSAGVYVGGEQTPASSTTLNVDVAGDVSAEIDGSALSQ
jgi:hypothetical protein